MSMVKEANALVLAGKSPMAAAKSLTRRKPERLASRLKQNRNIIEENRINFAKVELDELEMYRVFKEAMTSAMTTIRESVEVEEPIMRKGEIIGYDTHYETVYRQVPDWNVRMAAAKQYAILAGYSPKDAPQIQINTNTGNVNVSFGQLYANIGRIKSDEDALSEYNRMKNMEAQGELDHVQVIDAEYTEEEG